MATKRTKAVATVKEPDFQQQADEYARGSLESIREMVEALDAEDDQAREDAQQRIQEDALSVEVCSGWYTPGDAEGSKPEEYNILITTGGPAARIIGKLSEHGEPESAHFEYQDWFKPWTRARLSGEDEDVLLRYAQEFYFGE